MGSIRFRRRIPIARVAKRAGTKHPRARVEPYASDVLAAPENGMSFLLYIIGFIVFIAGLAWLATVLGISHTYIMIGAVILLGIGFFPAATRTRAKDPPAA